MEEKLRKQLDGLEYKPSDSLWDKIDGEIDQNGFERSVRAKLEHFESVPYPETWGRIESELPDPVPTSANFRYWGLAGLLMLFSTAAWLGFNYFKPTPQVLTEQTTILAPVQVEQPLLTGNAGTISRTRPQRMQQGPVLNTSLPPGKRIIPIVKPLNPENPEVISGGKVDLFAPVGSVKKPGTTTVKPGHSIKKQADEEIPEAPVTNSGSNEQAAGMVRTNDQQTAMAQPPAADTRQPSSGQDQAPSVNQVKAEEPAPSVQVRTVVPVNDSAVASSRVNGEGSAVFEEEPLSKLSISVVAGANICFNRLVAPSSSGLDFSENKALRKTLERPEVDGAGMFLVDYAVNERFRLSTGIGILNFSQSFYYDITAPRGPATSTEKGADVINPNDSIVSGNNLNTRIKYSWTEIPLLATYRFTDAPRFNFELQGGFSYAIISTVDAGMVSYDNIGVLLVKDKEAFPGIQNNFFVMLNPALTFRLNHETTLGFMPTCKVSLNSMISNDQWLQQYPYFFGASFSLRKRF